MSRLLAVLPLVFAVATLLPTAAAADVATGTIVVDDDNSQCPDAEISTIQKAVDKAVKKNSDRSAENDVNLVQVCPGLYVEQVSVREPLTIRGPLTFPRDAETVQTLDCFAATLTPDPNTQAIVAAPPEGPTRIFNLEADNIELQGFVVRGQSGPADSAAVITDSAHSGYQVHDNLIMGNTVAAFFRSSGVLPSSFAYNCLRDNGWGLANHRLPLVEARIHHNSTFRTANFGFELVRGTERVVLDHNLSRDPTRGGPTNTMASYLLWDTKLTTLFENGVASHSAVRLFGGNETLKIVDNQMEVSLGGVVQQSGNLSTGLPPESNTGALIQGNTIGGTGNSAGIGMGRRAVRNSEILDNVVTGLAGQGIALIDGNTNNVVRGNTVTNNGGNGIWAGAGATGNTFEANTMLGNGRIVTTGGVDARDDNPLGSNLWSGNDCVTDIPDGLCPGQ